VLPDRPALSTKQASHAVPRGVDLDVVPGGGEDLDVVPGGGEDLLLVEPDDLLAPLHLLVGLLHLEVDLVGPLRQLGEALAQPGLRLRDGRIAPLVADRQVQAQAYLRPQRLFLPDGVVGRQQLAVGIELLLRQVQGGLLGLDALGQGTQVGPGQRPGAQVRRLRQHLGQVELAGRWRQGALGRQVHQGVEAGDGHRPQPLQAHLPFLGPADLDVGLEHVLLGGHAGRVACLGVGAELAQQAQVVAVDRQGALDEVVVGEGGAGALDQLQAHVLDVEARGAGHGQGADAAQGQLAAPGQTLRHLQPVAAVEVVGEEGAGGQLQAEHRVVEGGHLGVAGGGGLPGGDHLGQRRAARQHLLDQRLGGQLVQARERRGRAHRLLYLRLRRSGPGRLARRLGGKGKVDDHPARGEDGTAHWKAQ
jgi:hypothetical protein